VSQYAAALIVEPGGMKPTRRMPFLSQKKEATIFFTETEVLNFWFWGNAYGAIVVTVAWIQECGEKTLVSFPFTMESRNSSPSCA
jgi:hypothetical protein